MPSGQQTTTTNTTAKPYKYSQPILNDVLKDARKAYNQGIDLDVTGTGKS